jgi:hypothetical protein
MGIFQDNVNNVMKELEIKFSGNKISTNLQILIL